MRFGARSPLGVARLPLLHLTNSPPRRRTGAIQGAMAMQTIHWRYLGWSLLAAALALPSAAHADERSCCSTEPGKPGSEEEGWTMTTEELAKLGKVRFPLSCNAAAQQPFEQGIAMLHSFWFDEATHAFSRIVTL